MATIQSIEAEIKAIESEVYPLFVSGQPRGTSAPKAMDVSRLYNQLADLYAAAGERAFAVGSVEQSFQFRMMAGVEDRGTEQRDRINQVRAKALAVQEAQ